MLENPFCWSVWGCFLSVAGVSTIVRQNGSEAELKKFTMKKMECRSHQLR